MDTIKGNDLSSLKNAKGGIRSRKKEVESYRKYISEFMNVLD